MLKEEVTSVTGKRGKGKKTQRQKENHSPAFKKFEQNLASLKYDSNEMAKAVFNRLTPGPLWRLNTVELEKAEIMLKELAKQIEGNIQYAKYLAESLKEEEHSMIMTKERAKRLKVLEYSDFICQPYEENIMVTRRKYQSK